MAIEIKRELDAVDWRLLAALQGDARLSFSELGRQVGLTQPAVAERVRRLEDAGVIVGYRAEVDLGKLGYGLLAFIRCVLHDHRPVDAHSLALIQGMPEILECHHVTGDDCYIMKVAVADVAHLEAVIGRLGRVGGRTVTSVVLSTPVTGRTIEAPPDLPAADEVPARPHRNGPAGLRPRGRRAGAGAS